MEFFKCFKNNYGQYKISFNFILLSITVSIKYKYGKIIMTTRF